MTDNGSKSGSGDNQDDSAASGSDNVVPIKDGQKSGRDKLTNKQRAFVRAMLRGAGSQSAAYREAYDADNMSAKAIGIEASRLMNNPSVALALTKGYEAIDQQTAHTGVSLRLFVEKELYEMAKQADSDANKLRALQLLGQGEKCGYFLERSTSLTPDDLSPDQVLEELEARLAKAFEPKAS
jgi:hypothetical protein